VSTLTGAGPLARLMLRRDRVRLPIWAVAVAGLVYAQAASIKGLYPDPAKLAEAARLVEGNAAFIAMAGPPLALDTVGGRTTFEISAFAMVLSALMSLLLVTRHVRGDEEAGRAELLRSTVVGRHAGVAAALALALAANVVLGALVLAGLLAVGLDGTGSAALAAGIAGVGLCFAGVAAVTSQVTVSARVASGLAGAGLGASFVLRAIGDVGTGTLSWLSPMGWGQALRPFAGERWWPAALLVGATVACAAGAFAVNNHRDVGAGILRPAPGLPRAGSSLAHPVGLAARLHRGALAGWAAGLFLGGLAYGSVAGDVEDLIGDNEVIADLLAQGGGSVVDSFLATSLLVLALISAGFTVQATLRLRSEEREGRAEPVLAAAVSRSAWAASHLVVVAVGSVLVLAAAGLGTGLAFAFVAGGAGDVPRLAGAAVTYAPALLVLAGGAMALYGLRPGAASLAWAALALCFVVGFFGPLLSLPGWMEGLSPFQHVPKVPAAAFGPAPLAVLTVVASALTAAGGVALRRRDIGAA
jgi:ABC-2 type transport system permease protein